MKVNLLQDRLAEVAARVEEEIAKANRETAEAILAQAQEVVPVKTGNLRGTLQIEGENDADLLVTAGAPSEESPEGADYAQHVEAGHHTTTGAWVAPRPYLTPAAEGERERHIERAKEAIARAVEG